ncbi:M23 family metallopeptidase [bacterium]|nr:M23 family metallopeptidase [bacterium]
MKLNGLVFLILLLLISLFQSVSLWAAPEGFTVTVTDGYELFLAPAKPSAGQALVVVLRIIDESQLQKEVELQSMTFCQRKFQLEPIDGGWRGVAAVPLGTVAGTYELSINSQVGIELVLAVAVDSHDYGEQRLTVKKEMATPMRPENLKRIKQNRRDLEIAYGASAAQFLSGSEFVAPLTTEFTSPFGTRRLLNGKGKSPHGGVDFKAAIGVPVGASARGRVVLAEELYYSGKIVIIDHGLSVFTLYMHLSEIECSSGDEVDAGQIIGKSGKSGRVTGPHLHWGVKIAGVFVDPLRFVDDSKYLLMIPWEVGDGKGKL